MNGSRMRNVTALGGFAVMVTGIGLTSIPWALAVGGCVVLLVSVIGELRS